ncbi:MAG: sulfatase-like hydrolase/transferase [Chitinophagales bacterium]
MHPSKRIYLLIFTLAIIFSIQQPKIFAQATDQPHIIFIILDDLNDYVEGFNGHPQVQTPYIKTIAENGTSFTRAYCPSPQCGPSRMSMFTGKDAGYTNIYTNTDIICNSFRDNFTAELGNEEVITLPQFLKDSAGYFTYGINKIFHCHEDYPDFDSLNTDVCNRAFSWNKLLPFPGGENHTVSLVGQEVDDGVAGLNYAPIANSWEDSMYDYLAIDSAIGFLDAFISDNSIACNKPLFLAVGFRRPHNPLFIPEKYFTTDYFSDFYEIPFDKPYNDPPNAFPFNGVIVPPQPADGAYSDLYDLPEGGVGQVLALETGVHDNMLQEANGYWGELPDIDPALTNDERLEVIQKSIRANAVLAYLAAIKFADAQIGRLYDFLLANPDFLNNSIIIITSDNGYSLDEKKHWRKGTLWETDIRIPLIISDMRNIDQKVCEKPVSLTDLYPTLVDMLELNPPKFSDGSEYLDGRSLVPLMNNPGLSWPHPVLVSYRNKPMNEGHCFPQYTVRDSRFHYIYYTSNDSVYGLDSTCNELNNIIEKEFYEVGKNYEVDPNEWNNLVSDADYLPAIQYLQQWLPNGEMYLQSAYEAVIQNNDNTCLYEQSDSLFLVTDLFDTSGNFVTDISAYTLEWTNNITTDVFYGNAIMFPMSLIPDEQFENEQRIIFYLHVFDAEGRNVGFDLQYYFMNPAENLPEVSFSAEMINGNTTVSITDFTISGTYNSTWWDFGDGTIVYDLIPAPHIYLLPGNYTITNYVQYGNDVNCIISYNQSVTVTNTNPSDLPLNLYPNPAQSNLTVSMNQYDAIVFIEVFDVLGRKHFEIAIDSSLLIQGSYTLDISALQNGQYILKCVTGNEIYIGKFIILR